MKSNIKIFINLFIIWIIIGAFVLLKIEKGELVLWFNENRTAFGNFFFTLASSLAEWKFILLFLAILLYNKYGNTFIIVLTWAFTGIIVQSLKRVFDLARPAGYFQDIHLNFLQNESIHYAHSFPSGHTTTAFAIFVAMSLMTNKKYYQLIFFMLALSVAFSRVYLLQHFFIDVYFGSILGLLIGYFTFVYINSSNIFGFQNWKNKKMKSKFRKY